MLRLVVRYDNSIQHTELYKKTGAGSRLLPLLCRLVCHNIHVALQHYEAYLRPCKLRVELVLGPRIVRSFRICVRSVEARRQVVALQPTDRALVAWCLSPWKHTEWRASGYVVALELEPWTIAENGAILCGSVDSLCQRGRALAAINARVGSWTSVRRRNDVDVDFIHNALFQRSAFDMDRISWVGEPQFLASQ